MKMTMGNYPAPLKIVEVLKKSVESKGLNKPKGYDIEADGFSDLCITPQSQGLQALFFAQTAAKKNPFSNPRPVNQVRCATRPGSRNTKPGTKNLSPETKRVQRQAGSCSHPLTPHASTPHSSLLTRHSSFLARVWSPLARDGQRLTHTACEGGRSGCWEPD
jgi:hypothetical protein